VGDRVVLLELLTGQSMPLSRLAPDLCPPGTSRGAPLADPYLSRSPWHLRQDCDGVRVDAERKSSRLVANGEQVVDHRSFSAEELDRGVVLELADRVVLVLHRVRPPLEPARERFGLVGANESMELLRKQIERAAVLDVPVLLRGETGTGKELVARAIHAASPRSAARCVCVNMGAIPASVAASELFGHAKGAFTGATQDRDGYFAQAHGGTLFLDEIGETPGDVQPMLLRALETMEIHPLGGAAPRRVDARLITATDADLGEAVEAGAFRQALLHRVAGYILLIPPLRERRDDIGRLLHFFLRRELETMGALDLLDAATRPEPWFGAALAARLCQYDWPGNVRQLRNAIRQIVISSRDATVAEIDAALETQLAQDQPHSGQKDEGADLSRSVEDIAKQHAATSGLSDGELAERDRIIEALAAVQNNQTRAAEALGMSRRWLITKMERYNIPRPRKKGEH